MQGYDVNKEQFSVIRNDLHGRLERSKLLGASLSIADNKTRAAMCMSESRRSFRAILENEDIPAEWREQTYVDLPKFFNEW